MICQMLFMAAAMNSPQALYYAETCYIKSLTYPITTAACIESLPGRKDEFLAREGKWKARYQPAFDAAKQYLVSVRYDFDKGQVPTFVRTARAWAKNDQEQGAEHMAETCDAHMQDLAA